MRKDSTSKTAITEPVAMFNRGTLEEIATQLKALLNGMQGTAAAADNLVNTLARYEVSEITEQWVRTWGETVNKKTAAAMLGVSQGQITKLTKAAVLPVTPDGRVLVRQAAEWANSRRAVEKAETKRSRTRRTFIP